MPNSSAHGKIALQPHRVLGIPRSKPAPETEFRGFGYDLKSCPGVESPLQESRHAGKICHSQPSRCRVFIVLNLLKPPTHAELMYSRSDLQSVGKRKQISVISRACRVV